MKWIFSSLLGLVVLLIVGIVPQIIGFPINILAGNINTGNGLSNSWVCLDPGYNSIPEIKRQGCFISSTNYNYLLLFIGIIILSLLTVIFKRKVFK